MRGRRGTLRHWRPGHFVSRGATRDTRAGRERRAELADGVDHGVAIDVVNEYAAFGNNDAFAGGAGLVATVASWSHIKL